MARIAAREALIKYGFVIPAFAGRLNQRFPGPLGRRSTQRGQVVLGILAILGIGFGLAFYTFHGPTGSTVERDKITAAALVQARDALIGYAAGQQSGGSYRPGDLPCPDRNDNGQDDDGNCNTVGQRIGRLPWKTLGLPDLRDSAGEKLWYAVSNNFQDNSRIYPLNSDTLGEYTITGLTSASNVIAVVFAAGTALGTQDRSTTATALCPTTGTNIFRSRCAANYLDGGNESGTTTFTTALPSRIFNDQLLLITRDNFFPPIVTRVTTEISTTILNYYTTRGYFPNANPFSDGTYYCSPTSYQGRIPLFINAGCGSQSNWSGGNAFPPWFSPNNWNLVIFYAVGSNCTSSFWLSQLQCSLFGGLTVSGVSSNARALIIGTGRGFPGQTRPCAAASDCLDPVPSTPNNENYNGDTVFVMPAPSATNNDRLLVVSP